jgi:hypothetical protein
MLRPGEPLDQRSLERKSRAQKCPRWQREVGKLESRCHDARAQREPPARRLGRLQNPGGDHRHGLFARRQIGTEPDGARPALVEQVEQERVAAAMVPDLVGAEHLVERGELARPKQEPDRRGGGARAARAGDRDRRAEELAVVAALGVGNEAELIDQA